MKPEDRIRLRAGWMRVDDPGLSDEEATQRAVEIERAEQLQAQAAAIERQKIAIKRKLWREANRKAITSARILGLIGWGMILAGLVLAIYTVGRHIPLAFFIMIVGGLIPIKVAQRRYPRDPAWNMLP